MDIESIKKILGDTRSFLEKKFGEEVIQDKIKTDYLQNQMIRFSKDQIVPLEKEIEHAIEVFKSPVYIGFLGRYSHGKTSLLNALFNLKDEESLPTGEGVVTSKVTYAHFDNDVDEIKAYEIKKGCDEQQEIDLSSLKKRVGRNMDSYDTSGVNYYEMVIPTKTNDAFTEIFAKKNIHLVDMPGLGGQYFKDRNETRRYLHQMDLVIAVIQMSQIQESSLNIASLLDDLTVPIIPVLTMSDRWTKSGFEECETFDEALEKAKENVDKFFPSLKTEDIIAVHTITNTKDSNIVPNNINELRSLIFNRIELPEIAINKARKEVSPVFKKKLKEYRSELQDLMNNIHNVSTCLSNMIKEFFNNELDKDVNIARDARENRSVKRIERKLPNEIRQTTTEFLSGLGQKFESLKNVTKDDYESRKSKVMKSLDVLKENSNEAVKSGFNEYLDEFKDCIQNIVDNLQYDQITKKEINSMASNAIQESKEDFSVLDCFEIDFSDAQLKEVTANTRYKTQVSMNFVKQLLSDKSTLLLGIGGVGLLLFGGAVPYIGKFLLAVGSILLILSLIITLTKRPNKTALWKQILDSDIIPAFKSAYDVEESRIKIQGKINDAIETLCENLSENLNGKEYNADKKYIVGMRDYMDIEFGELNEKLKDILIDFKNESKY